MVSRCPRPPASCWGPDYNGELPMSSGGHNNHNTITTSSNITAKDQHQTWHVLSVERPLEYFWIIAFADDDPTSHNPRTMDAKVMVLAL